MDYNFTACLLFVCGYVYYDMQLEKMKFFDVTIDITIKVWYCNGVRCNSCYYNKIINIQI